MRKLLSVSLLGLVMVVGAGFAAGSSTTCSIAALAGKGSDCHATCMEDYSTLEPSLIAGCKATHPNGISTPLGKITCKQAVAFKSTTCTDTCKVCANAQKPSD
jgi:hypothetical protein